MQEMRVDVNIVLEGDASAAYQNANKLGPGKVKHLEASAYFIKEAVRKKAVRIQKIPRKINTADLHTHHLNTMEFEQAMRVTGTKSVKDLPKFVMLEQHKINKFDDLEVWYQNHDALQVEYKKGAKHVDLQLES